MARGPRAALAGLAIALIGLTAPVQADVTFRTAADAHLGPPGTERIPVRIENGQIYIEATLRGPSGRSVTGPVVLDTGAPGLVIGIGSWHQLQLDTLVQGGSFLRIIRRSLTAVELGSSRVPELDIGGVVPDSLLRNGIIGLLGPSLIKDRALVLDYAEPQWSMVPPRLAVVKGDPSTLGQNLTADARVRRSRAAYAAVLGADAVSVPFRLFQGGRILVTARACEDNGSWCSSTLNLLLDTGASACVLFDDAAADRVRHATAWPRLRDQVAYTMLGSTQMDATVVPSLELVEASSPLAMPRVDLGLAPRRGLPDIEGELPERVHGLLGATFLDRFRLVIDYGNQIVWLEPRLAGRSRTFRGSHIGVRLERRWGEVRVAAVARGSSAAASGITLGDVVVSIDGAVVANPDEGETRLEGRQGSEVVLVTRHEGWERVQRLKRTTPP